MKGCGRRREVGRRRGSFFVFASVLLGLLAVAPTARADGDRPNILLLVAEDLSPRIGSFGDDVARTPRLDALAREGVRFSRVFTAAPVCAPSRAALITGVPANAIGAQHMRTSSAPTGAYRTVPPPEVKAFPELLRAAGYYTFTDAKLDYQFSGPLAGSGPFTIWDAEGRGTSWRGRAPGQPFFGLVNFEITHESGTFAPLGSWPHGPMHLLMQVVRAWTLGTESESLAPDPTALTLPPYYPDIPSVRSELARHYGNIAAMDRQVGALLDALERDELADETIVFWTSDHGDGLPRAKRDLFDSGLRVPLIVRWPASQRPPDVAVGSIVDRLVSFVDLAPTILALAGVAQPAWMRGQDFLDPQQPARRFVFAARDRMDEVVDRQRAVRDARFKYIRSDHPELPGGHPLAFRDNQQMTRDLRALFEAGRLDAAQSRWFEAPGRERLYDVESDPFEVVDRARDPAYADELARLRAALDAWLAEIGDPREIDERKMVEGFLCDGRACGTPAPEIRVRDGVVEVLSSVAGASIGYRIDDGPWRLYSGPIAVVTSPPNLRVDPTRHAEPRAVRIGSDAITAPTVLTAKAVRYGWDESEEVALSIGRDQ